MPIDDFHKAGYDFLSNFWPSPIDAWGRRYPTNEHYYQAMKARRKADHDMIRLADTAREAKKLGKHIETRNNWNIVKIAIMKEGLDAKFSIPRLKQQLLATNNEILIEGNTWHDNYWGDCRCPRCQNIKGVNMLGTLLMSIRSEIMLNEYRLVRKLDLSAS